MTQKEQENIVKVLVSRETERQFEIYMNKSDKKEQYDYTQPITAVSSYYHGSVLVRNILHTLTTGEQLDSSFFAALQSGRVDLDTFNNNTNLLQTYANNFSGGFTPSRTDPAYY